jgi:CheY-like chemotaxis protein
VVEDQEMVRELMRRILENAGYRVLTAADGAGALDLAGSDGSSIDLLLADLVLPDLNGRELARRLRERRPDLRVVLVSGYADDTAFRRELADGDLPLVEKPFRESALTSAVRAALEGPAG